MNYRFRKYYTILTYKYDGWHHTFKTTKINLYENDFQKFTLTKCSRNDSRMVIIYQNINSIIVGGAPSTRIQILIYRDVSFVEWREHGVLPYEF